MTNMDHKKMSGPPAFIRFFFFGIAAALFFGLIVMLLWNAILPALLGVATLTYWKAVGLLLLTRILFGSFHGRPGRHGRHPFGPPPYLREKFMNMTEEERKQFKEQWRQRCPRP